MTESDEELDRLDVEDLARDFRAFANTAVKRLPLYRRLCLATADDLEVCERLAIARPDQRTPNLLLAAVHDVLLAGAEDELANWYPSIRGKNPEGRTLRVGKGNDDPWPHFRRLALEDPTVEGLLRTRSTQTNEVGRSAALFPALFQATAGATSRKGSGSLRPISIVEIGSSAGLNLDPRVYGFRYHLPSEGPDGTQTIISVGDASRLMLDCEVRGPLVPPVPLGPVPIEGVIGIDTDPIDLREPEQARWLEACLWPEERDRVAQLRAAIALARDHQPEVVYGDAVDDLRRHVEAVPPHALPVIVATWVLAYLSISRRVDLMAELQAIGAERDVAMVIAEQPERVYGIPIPPRPDGKKDARATALVRIEWREGTRTVVRLADQHPHGRWIEWLDPQSVTDER